jgi:beta-galactosidase
VLASFDDGWPALVQSGRVRMTTACFDPALQRALLESSVRDAGIEVVDLPEGGRLRRLGNVRFAFNYGEKTWQVPAPEDAHFVLGGRETGSCDVAAWIETH